MNIFKFLSETLRLAGKVSGRFPATVLTPLREAGWHQGRIWEPARLEEFVSRFDTIFPSAGVNVLSEFGGLNIGSGGRIIIFGHLEDSLCASHRIIGSLVNEPLFLVGWTNRFEDDGLGVLMDEAGRVYVDGATGYDPPRDYRVDWMADDIDSFLTGLFSGKRMPEKQSWYYSQSDLD
ncbi:SUKH-3 domain-containing protein [Luteolibacter sp. Populi]|uniref:SUKH-3 domain-containing protein n=1 Tax=Luteolibacter sp. Populi TaxID=3230487 RepID=UPI003466A476